MSLVRLQLRQALVAALTNDHAQPWPTIAGPFVFDSKVDPPEHTAAETLMPCVIVYTDADSHEEPDRGAGRVFTRRAITCVVELVIGTFERNGQVQGVSAAETDAEMEALMDLFEWQVWRAINHPAATGNRAFNGIVKRIEEWRSEPARAVEQANRLALRQIVFTAHTANDCLPFVGSGEFDPPPADLPLFDAPYLDALATSIDANPDLAPLGEQLRRYRAGLPDVVLPALKRVRMSTDFIDPVVDPNRLPPGTTIVRGPDGRIELVTDINLNGDGS